MHKTIYLETCNATAKTKLFLNFQHALHYFSPSYVYQTIKYKRVQGDSLIKTFFTVKLGLFSMKDLNNAAFIPILYT